MIILPVQTPILKKGDDLASVLSLNGEIQSGDIIVISSKAIATVEGGAIDLSTLSISDEAKHYAQKTGRTEAFMQAVLNETKRLNGSIVGHCPGALLTELRPSGMRIGTIFAPNAGMDESNILQGFSVGWPINPVGSIKKLKADFLPLSVAILISDSCCRPRRLGVTACALTVAGFDPLRSEIGSRDLFGRELHITVESVADQLATAANAVMGNAAQATPAAIIRDHGIPFSDYCGWVDGMEPENDLFRGLNS